MTKLSVIEKYLIGQKELGIPNDIVLGDDFVELIKTEIKSDSVAPQEKQEDSEEYTPQVQVQEVLEHDKREKLKNLYYKCSNCCACSLSKTRKKFVFGAGTAYTDIMVIGEAPGEQEDLQGKPFVGPAGELLTKMLAAIHIDRNDIFIANILKCRPPMNRTPNQQETETCMPILKKQIEIIKPKALLLLGKTAASAILRTDKSVGSLRAAIHSYNGCIPAIVSYHPSALLRDASWKKPAWEDLQEFEKLVKAVRNG